MQSCSYFFPHSSYGQEKEEGHQEEEKDDEEEKEEVIVFASKEDVGPARARHLFFLRVLSLGCLE